MTTGSNKGLRMFIRRFKVRKVATALARQLVASTYGFLELQYRWLLLLQLDDKRSLTIGPVTSIASSLDATTRPRHTGPQQRQNLLLARSARKH
jgi:hypothetical protein